MTEFKGTPGPWEATFTDCLGRPVRYCRIRPVNREMFGYSTPLEIATMYMMDEAEQQANARLIAAAPDLLVALEMMVEMIEMNGFGRDYAMDVARAAIAKALGETT